MENKVLILSEREVKSIINADIVQAMEWVRQAVMIESKDILMPAKSSQILDDISKERVNCMPSTLLSHNVSGVKLISVFPKNKARGHKNVNGTLVLNETIAGLPIAFMGAAYLTLLRTAAIGVLASQYLAPSDVKTVGLIGAGEQARMHFYLLKYVHKSIKKCCVSSGSDATVEQFIHCFENEFPDVEFVACGQDYDSAVRDADIIVTATSSQRKLLRADTIKQGAFYIHVGGIEDEYLSLIHI